MTLVIELADDPELSDWTELTEVKRETLRCGGIANKTEIGTGSGFDWWDDAGGRVLPGRRPIRVIETATSPDTTLFYGRVSVKGLRRGIIRTGDAKELGNSLDDRNADLYGIIVDQWVRPAETDVARVQALLADYLSGASSSSPRARVSTDLADTYVASSPTIALPAETYVDSSPAQVLQEIVAITGKECFVTVDGELFYDAPTSTAYASTYSITDDDPDMVDELPPIWDGDAATEDPSELLSGARAKYGASGAVVSDSRSAVEDAFDKWEDTVFLETGSAAQAALMLDTLLDNQGIEEKSRQCTIEVPEDQVDRIKWGQTISFRAAAADDLTPVTLRISYLLWEVPISPEAPYKCHLELSKPKKIAPRIKKGTNPATIPTAPAPPESWGNPDTIVGVHTFADREAASQVVERYTDTQPSTNDFIDGAIILPYAEIIDENNYAPTPDLAVDHDRRTAYEHDAPAGAVSARLRTRLVALSATNSTVLTSLANFAIYQGTWGAVLPTWTAHDPTPLATGTIDVAGTPVYAVEFVEVDVPIQLVNGKAKWMLAFDPTLKLTTNAERLGVESEEDRVPGFPIGAGGIQYASQDQIIMQRADIPTPTVPMSAGSADATIFYHLTFYNTSATPQPGQWVGPEFVGVGNGVTTAYFTRFPYAPGSLRVYTDNLREFNVTETDPDANSFTFDSAPFSVEDITVEYRSQ